MWWLFQVPLGAIFLLSIVLSIPIAFDVGGRDSGLAYSLALFFYYFLYSIVRIITTTAPSRTGRAIGTLFRLSQWIVIPSLVIWALGRFAVDAGSTTWVERTFEHLASQKRETWSDWISGVIETITLGGWDKTLRYSIPVFQLLEGFCTLLVIQAAGQMTRWLVNRGHSDTWMIALLAFSGSVIASALYFLWRAAQFPHISNLDATLIGVTTTTALFLCTFGIMSRKGNPVESSLLFAYIVLCVYQIFTDYLPSPDAASAAAQAAAVEPEFPPLPPIIMASYSTFLQMLGSLPTAVHSTFNLLYAAFQTTTPSVITSLMYRIMVFYLATRIIPAVREYGAQAIMEESLLEDSEGANKLLELLSWFAPSVLIAIYTSLLLQHFSVSDGPDGWTLRGGDAGGNVWRWSNLIGTMALYAVELYLGNDDTNHFKVD